MKDDKPIKKTVKKTKTKREMTRKEALDYMYHNIVNDNSDQYGY